MNNADNWIEQLGLIKHPEGGYFNEVYRSQELIAAEKLPKRFTGERSFSTSIYYLLKKGEYSAFHRIKSDEVWHFYDGFPMEIIVIESDGKLRKERIGLNAEDRLFPQVTIKAGQWFAAQSLGDYSLVGCTVSPGFDFTDFELAERENLIAEFPHHQDTIETFTSI